MSATGLRVLLVNCNTPMDNLIPAGVSLLSAVLKAEGCEVRCFDTTFYRPADFVTGDEARAMTLQVKRTDFSELGIHPKPNAAEADFRALVAEFQPDLIGFSVIECTHHLALTLARAIADYRPEVPRIWGNVHATFAADRIIGAPEIDMLCVGGGRGGDPRAGPRAGRRPPAVRDPEPVDQERRRGAQRARPSGEARRPPRAGLGDLGARAFLQAHGRTDLGDRHLRDEPGLPVLLHVLRQLRVQPPLRGPGRLLPREVRP